MRIEAATLISTIGTAPNPLIGRLDLPTERGRVIVNPDLSVGGVPGVWALGDCAAVPNAADDAPAPPTAQLAVREAHAAAGNILRASQAKATEPFRFAGLGTIATVVNRRGIAKVMGVPISGLPAWLLWRAFYRSQMPTLGRKSRIYVEWTWDMLFHRDIAQLEFSSSADIAISDHDTRPNEVGVTAHA